MHTATVPQATLPLPSHYALATRLRPACHCGTCYADCCASLTLVVVNDLPEPADEALMLAYAGGDTAAFEQLYSRHRIRLYRFLLRQLRDPALADEFFQDIWQRVITAREGWKPEAAFTTWLFRIAHNRLTDHWRALKHRPAAPADGDERAARIPDPDTPERNLSDFEQRRRLQLPWRSCPTTSARCCSCGWNRTELEEIGEITGGGRETVKSGCATRWTSCARD